MRNQDEMRRLHKASEIATRTFMEALQKILDGDDSVHARLPRLLEEQAEAHKKFTEEAQHFVHWKQI